MNVFVVSRTATRSPILVSIYTLVYRVYPNNINKLLPAELNLANELQSWR